MDEPESSQPEPPSPSDSAERDVPIVDSTGRVGAAGIAWLHGRTLAAMDSLGAYGEVRVRVVRDDEMAIAHERWKDTPGTTDVLTFDLRESGEAPLDTDVLICLDEGERQAAARGHDVRVELLLYVVHAMLHCLGHDDCDEASAATMHRAEDDLLRELGVGAVFDRGQLTGDHA